MFTNQPWTGSTERLFRLHYQHLLHRGVAPPLHGFEFQRYSQNGEDGILVVLFAIAGTTNRTVVEICAGDGQECNAANLIVNHGWKGFLFDGDARNVWRGNEFYAGFVNTLTMPVFSHAWITAENVNDLVRDAGVVGPIDLLSLDIDGNDYWVWRALTAVQPRAVVLEFNALCGPEKSVAMSYDPEYQLDLSTRPYRCGASLPAFVKLGRSKGYRLVGVHSLGFNAFFMAQGTAEDLLPERTVQECYADCAPLRGWQPAMLEEILTGATPWQPV